MSLLLFIAYRRIRPNRSTRSWVGSDTRTTWVWSGRSRLREREAAGRRTRCRRTPGGVDPDQSHVLAGPGGEADLDRVTVGDLDDPRPPRAVSGSKRKKSPHQAAVEDGGPGAC